MTNALSTVAILALAVGALGAGCTLSTKPPVASSNLGQGWTDAERGQWYAASQGSRLIPYDWLMALEQPGGTVLFLSDDYIDHFRYVPKGGAQGVLPLGFAIDNRDDSALTETRLQWKTGQNHNAPWVGFNCSACHTSVLTYGGARYTVDGGATLADFQSFLGALNQALSDTEKQPDRFDRFAHRVLPGNDYNPANLALLRVALSQHNRNERIHAAMNATTSQYGHGRVDAIGYIFNKVVFIATHDTTNANTPDAPVSYPFLWNVPQHANVQWDGIAPNFPIGGVQPSDPGALVRNTGEVTGVFADVSTKKGKQGGYSSSVYVANLVAMEQLLGRLSAPKWPSPIPFMTGNGGNAHVETAAEHDMLVSQGATLFKDHCSQCHQLLRGRTDLSTKIPLSISLFVPSKDHPNPPPGTDRTMACNAAVSSSPTADLKGVDLGYIDPLTQLGETAAVSNMLLTVAGGELWDQRDAVIKSTFESFIGTHPAPQVVNPPPGPQIAAARLTRDQLCAAAGSLVTLGYKARPLNGVWATAPYLHNGSVPTLYDLLLPPAQRPPLFYVGSREFDPVRVGYQTAKGPDNPFPFDTTLRGNSNAGHDYGNAKFKDSERWALVEYLKTFAEP